MRNEGCSGGCLSFIAGIVLIGLVLLAVKWFGVPVGIGLGVLGFIQFKKFDTDPEGFDRTAKSLGMQPIHLRWASVAAMVAGVILVIASVILWTVRTDDSPSENGSARSSASASGPIPSAFRGSWAFHGDCANINSKVDVEGDEVSFLGGGLFSVTRASASDSGVVLYGTTISSPTLRDTSFQSDRMTLSLSNGGQAMTMNFGGSEGPGPQELSRCSG